MIGLGWPGASRGGVALSVVGLGIACNQIAHAGTTQKKNEIFVESMGGLIGGLAFAGTATITLFFVATPVGWVAALAIGAGGALAGYGGGEIAKGLYDRNGMRVDFANNLGVSSLCKPRDNVGIRSRPMISSAMQSVL